jgi:hypothetical protein
MQKGSTPVDGGNLIIEENEYDEFIRREPGSQKFIRPLLGSMEFINKRKRYCLWLDGITPNEIKRMPEISKRIEAVREFRLKSPKAATRRYADFPTRFMEIRQPAADYLVVPKVSSENRRYIPIGYILDNTISTDLLFVVHNANLYHFGVMTSNVHMAWTRAVCGRMKSDYRYSNTIVYNNFPWPSPTNEQLEKIKKSAQAILDAREKYPDSTYADMYGEHIAKTGKPPSDRRFFSCRYHFGVTFGVRPSSPPPLQPV